MDNVLCLPLQLLLERRLIHLHKLLLGQLHLLLVVLLAKQERHPIQLRKLLLGRLHKLLHQPLQLHHLQLNLLPLHLLEQIPHQKRQ
jgi:hypothetical protein